MMNHQLAEAWSSWQEYVLDKQEVGCAQAGAGLEGALAALPAGAAGRESNTPLFHVPLTANNLSRMSLS